MEMRSWKQSQLPQTRNREKNQARGDCGRITSKPEVIGPDFQLLVCRPSAQNFSKPCAEVSDTAAKMACNSESYTVVQRLLLSGIHAGVASSHWLSVNWRTSVPSLRMTNNSP